MNIAGGMDLRKSSVSMPPASPDSPHPFASPSAKAYEVFISQKLLGGLMFSRDTVGDAQNSAQMSPCSGATGRVQKLF